MSLLPTATAILEVPHRNIIKRGAPTAKRESKKCELHPISANTAVSRNTKLRVRGACCNPARVLNFSVAAGKVGNQVASTVKNYAAA